ncbi:MAG TPA: carbohydrate-binding domain-containing protein [Caldisericia bacterium]|nr:carbohydrate-binding domain-containing protein [Caldisericia bacterium]HPF48951.1 carbohydrate-binding domain-containing protein [Caldisericia bacterium]HPI83185.1 carbohydrate-binding domain-containing protein [Caldisericia bacterium]HPQ92412.1 carbohydrate-binding domain-containing protein [Caldisericia bacterium]HRV74490.1 carbohydrate-binding domain-containing protein [Caldisericia bacterium]
MNNLKTAMLTILLIGGIIFAGCSAGQTVNEDNNNNTANADSTTDIKVEYSVSKMFTERDLEQTVYAADGKKITLESNKDVEIDGEGIYIVTGKVNNTSIIIDADKDAKVQIALDNVTITNETQPAIYVKSADKVFVTIIKGSSELTVSGEFVPNDFDKLDAVIFSKSDLVLNGNGNLKVVSNYGNGITSKDDLKVTGGSYDIQSSMDAIEANDSIRVYDGTFNINTSKDALHSENEEDDTLGYIYIHDCDMTISAKDDGIRANSIVQIDGGTINIETCVEGIEGTFVQINGGDISIYSTDDGVNASRKSNSYDVVIELNGGNINVDMAAGDTDAFDSNGDIYVNGGTITVNARSSFDPERNAEFNGGTVIINGEQVTELPISMMGGGPRGGDMGGNGGRQPRQFDIQEVMKSLNIVDGILTLSDGTTYEVPEGETPKLENNIIIFTNGVEIDVHKVFGFGKGFRPDGENPGGEPPGGMPGMNPMELDIEQIIKSLNIVDGTLTLPDGTTYEVPEGETPKLENNMITFTNGVSIEVHRVFDFGRGFPPDDGMTQNPGESTSPTAP